MKVKLLKKLRAQAKDVYYILRDFDAVNHVYVYNIMWLNFSRTVIDRVSDLDKAKRICNNLRREYILREIRYRRFGNVNRVY